MLVLSYEALPYLDNGLWLMVSIAERVKKCFKSAKALGFLNGGSI